MRSYGLARYFYNSVNFFSLSHFSHHGIIRSVHSKKYVKFQVRQLLKLSFYGFSFMINYFILSFIPVNKSIYFLQYFLIPEPKTEWSFIDMSYTCKTRSRETRISLALKIPFLRKISPPDFPKLYKFVMLLLVL